MQRITRAAERGQAFHGWLRSFHTFSFGDYHNPEKMGFRVLRVINEDRIAGGRGFQTHGHSDMEILSYVIEGALEHKDTIGTTAIIKPGEFQRMSAGTGIEHSEVNHERVATTHFLQIWILPEKKGVTPSYGQKSFVQALEKNELVLMASRDGSNGSVSLNADVNVYAGKFSEARIFEWPVRSGRHVWIQIVKGELDVNGESLAAGDGMALSEVDSLTVRAPAGAEFLIFDLP